MDRIVAVTGGSGFIGTHVVDALLDAGCTVRVLDPKPPHRADAEWVPVDVLDTNGLVEPWNARRLQNLGGFTFLIDRYLASSADAMDELRRTAAAVADADRARTRA